MSENLTNNATETVAQPAQPVKLGAVQRVEMAFPSDNQTQTNQTLNNEGANAINGASNGAEGVAAPAPTVTDEQLKEYFKAQGIDYEGIEKLKEKLSTPVQTNVQETTEQLQAKELAKEKRMLDKFITGGGTAEQYVALKNLANGDLAELSKNTVKKELKDAGFNDTEIEGIIKERYYQYGEDDLEQFDEESDKDFAKRKKEYGDKILSNRSLPIKNQAAGILADIQSAIDSEDLQASNELSVSANIDEQFKTLSRKDTYEIGEINGKAIPPVESEVPETELAAVREMLLNPTSRKQFLHNQDGSLNITNITNVLVENAKLKSAIKTSYHEGSTRTNAHWEKVFPARNPQEIGIGGSQSRPNGQQNGAKPFSLGKVQRVTPQRQ